MSEQQFYVNGNWYTYEEAHNLLGLTRSRPENVTFLNSDFSTVQIRKDVDDNTFYDSENHIWHDDINEFSHPLYRSLGEITLYRCEAASIHDCYTDTVKNDDPKFVNYDSEMTGLDDLYNNYGMTQYRCAPYIVSEGIVIAWYDGIKELYWNDREGYHRWQQSAPQPESPPVDVSDFDILNIDMRPSLEQYTLSQEQMSNIEFMKFNIDIGLNIIDDGMQDYDLLNLPIEIQLQLYNPNQQLQLLLIRV